MSRPVTQQDGLGAQRYDPAEVRARTEEVLAALRCPARIPDHFDALRASDRELVRYGLPPRPDRELWPALYDVWERVLRVPMRSAVPEFSVTGVVHVPAVPLDATTSATWSGAVAETSSANETFQTVTAQWVVPNAWPPLSAQNGNGWNDGIYKCSSWVGIDGYNGSQELLQGGTSSVAVVSGGQITSQRSYAWYEWYPAAEIAFLGVTVNPGDLVCFLVCGLGESGDTQASVSMVNQCSGKTASTIITAPGNNTLLGATAEWITEDPTDDSTNQPFLMPDYGAVSFFNAIAGSNTQEHYIDGAVLINMVSSGGLELSSAVEQGPEGLLTLSSGGSGLPI